MILVDTSVLSLVLRRRRVDLSRRETHVVRELERISLTGLAGIVGPVRQELLSGVRAGVQFERLREALDGFPLLALATSTWDEAARCSNLCRSRGLAASQTDMLLCAVCIERDAPLFTLDADFPRYARCLPIRLHYV